MNAINKLFKNYRSRRKEFWKQTSVIVVGTTISLVVTIASSVWLERRHRAKSRQLTAMMVMSNIESFARTLNSQSDRLAHADSVGTWLLSQPLEALDTMPEEKLDNLVNDALKLQFISHDHTTENIFSNNIETWQNLGNFVFIDKVGQCFSSINTVEEYWNGWVNDVETISKAIGDNPNDYPGSNRAIKFIQNSEIRNCIKRLHNWRGWMNYVAATLRYHNKQNLAAIGIEEKELMAFTDERAKEVQSNETRPDSEDYYLPALNPDSIFILP